MRRDIVTRDPVLQPDIGIVLVAGERHCCGLRVSDAHQSETIALYLKRCCACALIEQSMLDAA